MTKTYHASKGWRIFFSLSTPLPLFLCSYHLWFPLVEKRPVSLTVVVPLMLLGVILTGGILYVILGIFRWRVEVLPDRLREINLFWVKELEFERVKGVRLVPTGYMNCLDFVSKDAQAKRVRISLMMSGASEFVAWAFTSFRDLAKEEEKVKIRAALRDEALGGTRKERALLLRKARVWGKYLKYLAWAVFGWGVFFPWPYRLTVGVLIVFPIFAVVAARLFSGAIKFDAPKGSGEPTIGIPMLFSSLALALRAVFDFQILNWQSFWVPFVVISAALYVLTLVNVMDVRRKVEFLLTAVFICIAYGYGVTITLNGSFDSKAPTVYNTQVIGKRVYSGKKHTSYYLKVSPWGPRSAAEDVEVSNSIYQSRNVGDQVRVFVRQGVLSIPWFYVK